MNYLIDISPDLNEGVKDDENGMEGERKTDINNFKTSMVKQEEKEVAGCTVKITKDEPT